MIPIKTTLCGEASLSYLPTTRFKAGLLSLTVAMPLTKQSACLAPLMLSVLHRGTQKYPTLADLNKRLDYLFGTGLSVVNYVKGDWMILGYSAELLDATYLPKNCEDITAGVLELMKEMLYHPVLDADGLLSEKYVTSEKIQQCDAIRSAVNSPRTYAFEKCKQILFAGQPAGIPLYGTEEETMAVTREELTAYWKEFQQSFCPNCFYIGSMDAEELKQKINAAFSLCEKQPKAISLPAQTRVAQKEYRSTEESLEVSQGQLFLAYRTGVLMGDEDFYPMTVMSAILGGTPVSKLFIQVREKRSLCYTCSASYNAFKGSLICYCGLDVKNRKQAENAMIEQVEAMKNGDFTEEDLAAAKRYLCNSYRQMEDSPAGLEQYFYGRALMGMHAEIADCMKKIEQVSKEDIIRAAKKMVADTTFFLRGTANGKGEEEDD